MIFLVFIIIDIIILLLIILSFSMEPVKSYLTQKLLAAELMFPKSVSIAGVELAIFDVIKLEAAGGLTQTLTLNRCLIQ